MAKVLITRQFPGPGIEMVRTSGHTLSLNDKDQLYTAPELRAAASGCSAILTQLGDVVDDALLEAAGPDLRVVSNYAVGFNNVDLAAAGRRGVVICNTPGVLTDATADTAWALLLGAARRVAEADQMVRKGGFTGWTPSMLLGGDLAGRTLAIIGAGRIGYAVAKRAMGWEMKILYVARNIHEDFERDFGGRRVELSQALAAADFVSIHVPLSDQTRHFIDEKMLKLMKKSAYLVNTARGPVVDEKALVKALREGWIAGAGLDVYEREPELEPGLVDCPNTVLLPHLGSATIATRSRMSELAARNLLHVLDGKMPLHCVNPEVAAAKGLK